MRWEELEGGKMSWTAFTSLRGSSTRSETAANMLSLLADSAVNLGTNSLSMLCKTADITKHLLLRQTVRLKDWKGALNLGGSISWLHRDRPYKRRWACMRGGDLWEHTENDICNWTNKCEGSKSQRPRFGMNGLGRQGKSSRQARQR